MANKLIPSGDGEFKGMSQAFSNVIAREPARFGISQEESLSLSQAYAEFESAYRLNYDRTTRSMTTTQLKTDARAKLEKIIQKIAQQVRTNESLSSADKLSLFIKERPTKLNRKSVPMQPPTLRFVRALHVNEGAFPTHELKFRAVGAFNKAKPEGAVRLELFVDLVPPNEPVPSYPGANGGRPWYLRSYTRSPIVLTPPMARVPMRVVYWARWADSSGETGPYSATAVGWIEHGLEHNVLQFGNFGKDKPKMIIEQIKEPETRTQLESMAIFEAHYLSFVPKQALPENVTINREALPSPEAAEETEAA